MLVNKSQMRQDIEAQKQELLDGVVRMGAEKGLSGISIRTVAEYANLKEMYIYRYFADKDDLMEAAFLRSDRNMFDVIVNSYKKSRELDLPYREQMLSFFDECWKYMVADTTYGIFYVRYYYSVYYGKEIRRKHREVCEPLSQIVRQAFRDDVDVDLLMHYLYTSALNQFMEIATGALKDTAENRRHFYNFLYNNILVYKKQPACEQ